MAHPAVAARTAAAVLGLALTGVACSPSASREQAAGMGRAVLSGAARAVAPSPDGAYLAVLDGCQEVRAQFLPPQTARCDLRIVPAGGGDATRIAAGVTTLPHGVAWGPDGALVAMADYDHAAASATLVRWTPAGGARTLADRVTFHGFGGQGELGFVSGGRLWVMLPGDAAPRQLPGADAVASFDLSPQQFPPSCPRGGAALRLVARRAQQAGGQLMGAGCALERLEPLEPGQVGDYGFARASAALAYTVIRRDGTALRLVEADRGGAAVDLGRGAQSFAFGPDGRTLAFVADLVPGKQGNLHLGGAGRKDQILAREVGEFRWAAAAPRLAWLEKYDPRVRTGVLGAGGPGLAPHAVAQNVSDLELSRDGERLAFLQHTARGGYSVDLGVAAVAAPAAKPVAVAQGVFGFGFSPDGKWLYYRTRCVRNGEACDLERVPAAGLAPGAKPEAVAPGVKSFEFDPRDPERLLVTWQRADLVALDVGVWSQGKLVKVDQGILPGSASFLGPDSRRLAYVVVQPKRQGVYVAEVGK